MPSGSSRRVPSRSWIFSTRGIDARKPATRKRSAGSTGSWSSIRRRAPNSRSCFAESDGRPPVGPRRERSKIFLLDSTNRAQENHEKSGFAGGSCPCIGFPSFLVHHVPPPQRIPLFRKAQVLRAPQG